jgi:TPR repeat protein
MRYIAGSETTCYVAHSLWRNIRMATKHEILNECWNDYLEHATNQQLLDFASQGDMEAQFRVAENYYNGNNGFKEDEKRAIEWYRKAALQGHEEAIEELEFLANLELMEEQ